jgi:myo-inositol-1(or 4)-monophosphatase
MDPTALPDRAELDALVLLATRLGRDAAALLVDGLTRVRASVETKSTSTDLVTEMDRASEQLLVTGILKARPEDGILGEEAPTARDERAALDDGRRHHEPSTATRVRRNAVVSAGPTDPAAGSLVGVVVDQCGDVYDGVAAFRRRAHHLLNHRSGPHARRHRVRYDADRRRRRKAAILPPSRHPAEGAATVDLCSVAAAEVASSRVSPWDLAAGSLIAAEAGAVVGDLVGGPPSGDFTLAAPPAVFAALRDLLAGAGAGTT